MKNIKSNIVFVIAVLCLLLLLLDTVFGVAQWNAIFAAFLVLPGLSVVYFGFKTKENPNLAETMKLNMFASIGLFLEQPTIEFVRIIESYAVKMFKANTSNVDSVQKICSLLTIMIFTTITALWFFTVYANVERYIRQQNKKKSVIPLLQTMLLLVGSITPYLSLIYGLMQITSGRIE